MNTNPKAIRILCYGDSNTYGTIPGDKGRYPANKRWTGLLQSKLGNKYEIIEEGLGGRTSVIDDLPDRPGKNGKTYLLPCLSTHYPIDFLILMLGTNDLKERFNRSPEDIARGIEELVQIIQEHIKSKGSSVKIILMSPPDVDESVPGTQSNYHGAEQKSKELAKHFKLIAEKHGCEFIDIAEYVVSSKVDGYHLEEDAHAKIAEVLADML